MKINELLNFNRLLAKGTIKASEDFDVGEEISAVWKGLISPKDENFLGLQIGKVLIKPEEIKMVSHFPNLQSTGGKDATSTIGKAALGAVIAGPVGALIGGLLGKKDILEAYGIELTNGKSLVISGTPPKGAWQSWNSFAKWARSQKKFKVVM
jgi:hypothetical protein